MIIFPAIDLINGRAVRLLRGNFADMTVYGNDPAAIAESFAAQGATHLHVVDLDGARNGGTPNLPLVLEIKKRSRLFVEIGGGVRSRESVERYLDAGVDRVILGTAALCDPGFLAEAVAAYKDRIAVGADMKDGFAALRGWLERSDVSLADFALRMRDAGVSTLICTDVSKDGAMQGPNVEMYADLKKLFGKNVTASGGVTTLRDLEALRSLDLYGAIVGKAIYEGAIDLKKAIEVTA